MALHSWDQVANELRPQRQQQRGAFSKLRAFLCGSHGQIIDAIKREEMEQTLTAARESVAAWLDGTLSTCTCFIKSSGDAAPVDAGHHRVVILGSGGICGTYELTSNAADLDANAECGVQDKAIEPWLLRTSGRPLHVWADGKAALCQLGGHLRDAVVADRVQAAGKEHMRSDAALLDSQRRFVTPDLSKVAAFQRA